MAKKKTILQQHPIRKNRKFWSTFQYLFALCVCATGTICFRLSRCSLLAISVWIDHAFYGQWSLVQLNFLQFNVVSELSVFYGSHPWHWYATQGFPVIMGPQILLFGLAVWRTQQPFVLALIGWTITLYRYAYCLQVCLLCTGNLIIIYTVRPSLSTGTLNLYR